MFLGKSIMRNLVYLLSIIANIYKLENAIECKDNMWDLSLLASNVLDDILQLGDVWSDNLSNLLCTPFITLPNICFLYYPI